LGTGSNQTVFFNIPQFNQLGNIAEGTPTPGYAFTLTSVALSLSWKATGNVTIYNINSTSNVGYSTAFAETTMTLQGPDGQQDVALGYANAPGNGTVPFNNVQTAPPAIFNIGDLIFTNVSGNGSSSQNGSNLGQYQGFGSGNYSAGVTINSTQVSGTSTDSHSGNLAYQGNGQMGAIATITYTYSEMPIPEPVTSSLVGGALVGIALIFRKRRA
jgi:hypothetical protein